MNKYGINNIYTIICRPVHGDDPKALTLLHSERPKLHGVLAILSATGLRSGLSSVQVVKPWYNYFIPPSSQYTLFSMKYFVLKFAISDKGGSSI